MAIPNKTLEDLEFESVVDNIVFNCVSSHGKKEAKSLKPLLDFDHDLDKQQKGLTQMKW